MDWKPGQSGNMHGEDRFGGGQLGLLKVIVLPAH
jgi:hypothetical protein